MPAGSMHGWHILFPPPALGKAYEHYVGKALAALIQLPTCGYTKDSLLTALVNRKARMVSCRYAVL